MRGGMNTLDDYISVKKISQQRYGQFIIGNVRSTFDKSETYHARLPFFINNQPQRKFSSTSTEALEKLIPIHGIMLIQSNVTEF